MDRLPFELVAAILIECTKRYRVPPELLSKVNRSIRYVVLNTADLWSFIYYGDDRDIPRMLVGLERSASAPLYIEMDITRDFPFEYERLTLIATSISPHFHRVRSFSLRHYEGWASNRYLLFRHDPTQRMEGLSHFLAMLWGPDPGQPLPLTLQDFVIDPQNNQISPFPRWISATPLKHLQVEHGGLNGLADTLELLKGSLESLDLSITMDRQLPPTEIAHALAPLERLSSLKLQLFGTFSPPGSQEPKIVPFQFPRLRHVTMRGEISRLLPSIHSPNLREVVLDFSGDKNINPQFIQSFLECHARSITQLDMPCYSDNIKPAITANPTEFPSLQTMKAAFVYAHTTPILRTIQAISLVEVDLDVYWAISADAICAFFAAASHSLRRATVSYSHQHPIANPTPVHQPISQSREIVFHSLESFISDSYLGDAVVWCIQDAPKLKYLQLNGLMNVQDLPELTNLDIFQSYREQMGTISFPILETLVVKEVSTVLVRIAAPQLRKLTIYAVSLNMTQATAGGVSFREPLDIALRVAVIRFILHHAPSLETLELYEPIARRRGSLPVDGPGSKAPQVDFGTWADSATFPRLSSVSLSPGDKLPNFMHTPVIRQLEIRSVAHRWIPSHNPYTQFSTAESLILHSAEKLNRTEAELDALGEVQHLKICLDPDAGLMLDELFFLRELIDERGVQPDEPSTSTSTSSAHKSVPLFPKLRSIHLHFSLWGDRNGWLFPGLQYYHSDPRNDADEDEDNPNDTGSLWADEMSTEYDTAEYYSNSSQWESSGESNAEDEEGELVEGEEALAADASAEQMTSLPVDQPAEDIHEPSAAEPSSDHDVEPQAMATGEDGYDDDEDPAWAAACSSSALDTSMTLSDARSDPSLLGIHGEWYYPTSERDARRIYGHVLAVLKDVVSSRASTNGVGPLRQLRITISPRVVGDFTVPGELQEWFRSHLDTFEA